MTLQTVAPQLMEADSRCMLEQRFPHIVQGLVAVWKNQDETDRYLNALLLGDRDQRHGLPDEIFEELIFLSDLSWKRRHFNQDGVQISADEFRFGRR